MVNVDSTTYAATNVDPGKKYPTVNVQLIPGGKGRRDGVASYYKDPAVHKDTRRKYVRIERIATITAEGQVGSTFIHVGGLVRMNYFPPLIAPMKIRIWFSSRWKVSVQRHTKTLCLPHPHRHVGLSCSHAHRRQLSSVSLQPRR